MTVVLDMMYWLIAAGFALAVLWLLVDLGALGWIWSRLGAFLRWWKR